MSGTIEKPWLRSDACVFVAWDLETSGPDPLQHEIVQIAAVALHDTFTSLIRPRRGSVTARARDVHGIGDEQLRSAPSFPLVLQKFLLFLSKQVQLLEHHDEAVKEMVPAHLIMVGHNSWVFDDVFLTAEVVAEWGSRGWSALLEETEKACGRRVFLHSADTLDASRHCGTPNKKLGTVLRWATGEELTESEAHTALGDASAVFRIAPHLGDWLECRDFVSSARDGLLRRCRSKLKKQPDFTSAVLQRATAPVVHPGVCWEMSPSSARETSVVAHPIGAYPILRNNRRCPECGVVFSRHFPNHKCRAGQNSAEKLVQFEWKISQPSNLDVL